jgi:hypothetical protein
MGEKQNRPFQLLLSAFLKVDFQGSRVTSEGGLILVRELDERLGSEPRSPVRTALVTNCLLVRVGIVLAPNRSRTRKLGSDRLTVGGIEPCQRT